MGIREECSVVSRPRHSYDRKVSDVKECKRAASATGGERRPGQTTRFFCARARVSPERETRHAKTPK